MGFLFGSDAKAGSLRGARVAVALVAVVGLVLPATHSAVAAKKKKKRAACKVEGQITTAKSWAGSWTRIKTPDFPPEDDQDSYSGATGDDVQHLAVDPVRKLIFVSNGVRLMRSRDGGCTWKQVFEVPLVPTPEYPFSRAPNGYQGHRIHSMGVASGQVLLNLACYGRLMCTQVLVSEDAGGSWRRGSWRIEAGGIRDSVLDPAGRLVYALTEGNEIWRSDDGGLSWSHLAGLEFQARGLVPTDPGSPQQLWAFGSGCEGDGLGCQRRSGHLFRSDDAGKTWKQVPFVEDVGDVRDLAVFGRGARPSLLLAMTSGGSFASKDGGHSWADPKWNSPIVPDSFVFGASPRQLLANGVSNNSGDRRRIYRYDARSHSWVLISPVSLQGWPGYNITSQYHRAERSFYFLTPRAIWKYRWPGR